MVLDNLGMLEGVAAPFIFNPPAEICNPAKERFSVN